MTYPLENIYLVILSKNLVTTSLPSKHNLTPNQDENAQRYESKSNYENMKKKIFTHNILTLLAIATPLRATIDVVWLELLTITIEGGSE